MVSREHISFYCFKIKLKDDFSILLEEEGFKMWGPIDPIGTIHMEKGWAYSPIPSPRIRTYLRTIS